MNWLRVTGKELEKLKLWLGVSTLLFAVSLVFFMGATIMYQEEIMMLFSVFLENLEEMAETVLEDSGPVEGTILLFANNFTASLFTMLLGPVLIFTLGSLMLNGGLIGVVGAFYTFSGEFGFLAFLVGILPHGILEIPALLISGAVGLKLGINLIAPPTGESRWFALKNNYRIAFRLLPLVVLLLAVAAVIEIFITPPLLNLFE